MEPTKEELAQRYSSMDDDTLIQLHVQGSLTPLAKGVIYKELTSRNISLDPDSLIERYKEPIETAPTIKETAGVALSGVIKIVIVIILLVAFNFILFGFSTYIAPIIWSTSDDRLCQKEGYWYGTESDDPEMVMCSSWWITPGRRGSNKH